jgi:hypothetical protein
MPEISRFFGMVVTMYYSDHPPEHFHVRYGRQRAQFSIETMVPLRGKLSPRAVRLIAEWTSLHQDELYENWDLARQRKPLKPIEPLQ